MFADYVNAVAWWPQGSALAAACLDGAVHVASLTDEAPTRVLAAHAGGALTVDVSPAGEVASGGEDGRIRIVSLARRAPARALRSGGARVEHLRWSSDGRRIAAAAGKVVRFWTADGALLGEPSTQGGAVAAMWWDAAGRTLTTACADGLRLLGPRRRRAIVHIPCDGFGTVLHAVESPDERYIAMAHLGGTVTVVQMSTSRSVQYGGFPGKVRSLAWSRSSRRLAVASGDRIAAFGFSPRGPERERARVLRGHEERVNAVVFASAPEGALLLSGCDRGRLIAWSEARDLRRVDTHEVERPIEHLSVSPDGRWLAVAERGGALSIFSTFGG